MIKSMLIIGNINNNLFMTEYVINLNNNNDNLSEIENIIKIKGFDFIHQFSTGLLLFIFIKSIICLLIIAHLSKYK